MTLKINYYYCYKHHKFVFCAFVYDSEGKILYWNQFVPDVFVAFWLSLSDGHLRRLQIIIVRSVMLSSSCYHLPSEYGTRSGGRNDVRKGVASLTEYTTYSKHSIDSLTDVTVEIHWRTEYTVDQGSSVCIVTHYGLHGRRIESWWGARYSALVQTSYRAHSSSNAKNIGCFEGVQQTELRLDHPLRQAPRLKKE